MCVTRWILIGWLAGIAAAAPTKTARDIDYGAYTHFLESKEKAKLQRTAIKLVQKLRGLYHTCPRCKGDGREWVIVAERYYDRRRAEWIPERKERQPCTRCNGDKMLFSENVAAKFIAAALDTAQHRDARSVKSRWTKRLKDCRVAFRRAPKLRARVDGRFGTVSGPRVVLFPLDFVLEKESRGYEWHVYDPTLDGDAGKWRGVAGVPAEAKIKKVHAADIYELENGMFVRLCGVVVPTSGNKIPKRPVPRADETARALVKAKIEGKVVTLQADKYSKMALDGMALVFVEHDGKDLGTEFLQTGLVRKHPKHGHMKKTAYTKAESVARTANAGCWAE